MNNTKRNPKKIVEIVQVQGICTRQEIENMDSRPWARQAGEMLQREIPDLACEEFALPDYHDYSTGIYDTNRFSYTDAETYMNTNSADVCA